MGGGEGTCGCVEELTGGPRRQSQEGLPASDIELGYDL